MDLIWSAESRIYRYSSNLLRQKKKTSEETEVLKKVSHEITWNNCECLQFYYGILHYGLCCDDDINRCLCHAHTHTHTESRGFQSKRTNHLRPIFKEGREMIVYGKMDIDFCHPFNNSKSIKKKIVLNAKMIQTCDNCWPRKENVKIFNNLIRLNIKLDDEFIAVEKISSLVSIFYMADYFIVQIFTSFFRFTYGVARVKGRLPNNLHTCWAIYHCFQFNYY